MQILVIGGTLFIGRLLVKELVKAGHKVTVLHRKPTAHGLGLKVASLCADRNDGAAMKAVLRGKQFDAVFDNVYDWERGTTAAQVEATVHACGDNLQRYIFMSSVAAYGDGLNHHESDGLGADDHPDLYVRNKAATERLLFRMHSRSGLPAVTLRPPFIYGPGNPYYREAYFWDRMRDKRTIIIPGDGRRLMQFVHVKDLVWCALRVLETPAAVGQAFNIANSRPIAQGELVEFLAKAAKKTAETKRVPREVLVRGGGHPMGPKFYFAQYYDMAPITQVVAKAQRVLKFKPVDFLEGLQETYRWWSRNNEAFPKPDYTYEDEMLAKGQLVAAGSM